MRLNTKMGTKRIGRRSVLLGLSVASVLPSQAWAAIDPALAEALKSASLVPDTVQWSSGVTMTAPAIADDAAAVPVSVRLETAMEVRAVYLFAPGNRRALVASLIPVSDQVSQDWTLRIRLAKTQSVAVVARLADGRLLGARSEVKVTVGGGCKP